MPCNSSEGMGDAYREDPEARRKLETLKRELDDVTDMLCLLLKTIDGQVKYPHKIQQWYLKHIKWDESQGRK